MKIELAQGCLLGQLAGDALGSLVEFCSDEAIRRSYPKGVRDLANGGTHNTIAGQPTDDSEMALLLARMLVRKRKYDSSEAFSAYKFWLDSGPFDCGNTIYAGLQGRPDFDSEANGAMMRISPLGIFGARHPLNMVGNWAGQDAALTHPNPVCIQANALFTMAIAHAIKNESDPESLYRSIIIWSEEIEAEPKLLNAIREAAETPPSDYLTLQGWVLIAMQNALWQLLHAPSLEEGVIDSVMRGGDTDTNAAICGALLGAVHGLKAIPERWVKTILNCRPKDGDTAVHRPRPKCFWPVDALELAGRLLQV